MGPDLGQHLDEVVQDERVLLAFKEGLKLWDEVHLERVCVEHLNSRVDEHDKVTSVCNALAFCKLINYHFYELVAHFFVVVGMQELGEKEEDALFDLLRLKWQLGYQQVSEERVDKTCIEQRQIVAKSLEEVDHLGSASTRPCYHYL